MPGLILKLRPHEELLINGVVIENGDKRTKLRIKTEGARILRLRDAMRPEEATTPLKRAYYIAQLAVSGEVTDDNGAEILSAALDRMTTEADPEIEAETLATLRGLIETHHFYALMRTLGGLIGEPPVGNDATGPAHEELSA